ncbi:MAG TPA: ABC transporter ATP-binding protein [Myxococcota bacterium]|nr:ABC transporter ATP-binding protein [Myxococcota bacterium]
MTAPSPKRPDVPGVAESPAARPSPHRALVTLERVEIGYGRTSLFQPLDIALQEGDFWGVVGPNGAGKTTLLRTLLGALPAVKGRVRYAEPRPRFGYVPQQREVAEQFPVTVRDVVRMGRAARLGPLRWLGKQDHHDVEEAIGEVGLAHLADRLFGRLSGGEKQRALIARAIASRPDVLVLDEPTAATDVAGGERIMTLVGHLHRAHNLTVVLVSHDLGLVARRARHVVLLDKERSRLWTGPVKDLLAEGRLAEAFGAPLDLREVSGSVVLVPQRSPSSADHD